MSRLKTILQRIHGLVPLTATGVVFGLGGLIAVFGFGVYREDRLLIVAGIGAFLMVAVGLVLTVVGAIWVRFRVAQPLDGVRLVVGHPGRTGFVFRMPFWLPLVDVRWSVADPHVDLKIVAAGRSLTEQWTPDRRGRHGSVVRWFTVGDVFGLAALSFPVHTVQDLVFVPDEGALRRVEVVRGLASGDEFAHPEGRPQGDLQDIRQYGAGDPIRYVLWKVFAKSRTLVVRSPERALSPVRRTAAFLVSMPGDQAAAGTAKTAFECGALGDEWTFGADGTHDLAQERVGALKIVLDSANEDADPGAGLARFIAASDAPRRVVVFAPALPGPWVARVQDVARRTKLELILCADRIVPSTSRGIRALVLQAPESPAGEVVVGRAVLAGLCRELAGVGDVRVADRRSGRVYGAAHLSKLTGAA